ncbi:hypothetical protein Q7C36_019313 [Tachysurus vachellii]|uniref:Uncharacterized protein n=1 Tax=Tachysurus vachellii TaxID=175792 RepID=A0AA88LW82_TACVA|nr:hypothetical protein Q7C36_019313 [Tachysurus vachellii]
MCSSTEERTGMMSVYKPELAHCKERAQHVAVRSSGFVARAEQNVCEQRKDQTVVQLCSHSLVTPPFLTVPLPAQLRPMDLSQDSGGREAWLNVALPSLSQRPHSALSEQSQSPLISDPINKMYSDSIKQPGCCAGGQ